MLVGSSKWLKQMIKIIHYRLRIPTGRRQTSWLFKSVVEDLNSALLWTNPASGQGGTWTRRLRIESPAPNHSAKLPPPLRFVARESLDFTKVKKDSPTYSAAAGLRGVLPLGQGDDMSIQFKVDRLQIILVAKKYISTCRNCSSVG